MNDDHFVAEIALFHLQEARLRGFLGFLGAGNNPMVGMTVAVAVATAEALK